MGEIKAVFYDMWGTLARLVPEQEELLVEACALKGIALEVQDARRGFLAAGQFWTRETDARPLRERSPEEKRALFVQYDWQVMRAAGVDVSPDQAYDIFYELTHLGRGSRPVIYEDSQPALKAIGQRGMLQGVISNMGRELVQISRELGIDQLLSIYVNSAEAGVSKPNPEIFYKALAQAGIDAGEALYVGDQEEIDVVGARAAGMVPLLLDRFDLLSDRSDLPRISSLAQLESYLDNRAR